MAVAGLAAGSSDVIALGGAIVPVSASGAGSSAGAAIGTDLSLDNVRVVALAGVFRGEIPVAGAIRPVVARSGAVQPTISMRGQVNR